MHESADQLVNKMQALRHIITQKFQLDVEDIAAAGAVSVAVPASCIASGGAIALTLANGIQGQLKFIWMQTDGGDATLTPASMKNGSTVTFNDVNDGWLGIFHLGKWHTLVNSGCTIA